MKNILVLGAGFGGLRTAIDIDRGLRKTGLPGYNVILIDQYPYHTFTPLLYETASVSDRCFPREKLESLVVYHISNLLSGTSVFFKQARVLRIDLKERKTYLGSERVPFEYLVLALGAETAYFGIPGLKENSFSLKTFEDAFSIRSRLGDLVNKKGDGARIIVGGGGSTGIELAAEIKMFLKHAKRNDIEVVLLEATPTLLPGFDEKVARLANKRLEKLGIRVMVNKSVSSVGFQKATLKDGTTLTFDLFMWTGGVSASSLTKSLPLKVRKEEKSRIEVVGNLSCVPEDAGAEVTDRIYAIGDIACIHNQKSKKMVPLVARAAIEQGKTAARNIVEQIKTEEAKGSPTKKFFYTPREYPYVIPVGGKFAIVKIGPFFISGLAGWFLKTLVELNYFLSIMSFGKAFGIWMKSLRIFSAND